jgi:hypothetical protein
VNQRLHCVCGSVTALAVPIDKQTSA